MPSRGGGVGKMFLESDLNYELQKGRASRRAIVDTPPILACARYSSGRKPDRA
jgi:hypothetical protein